MHTSEYPLETRDLKKGSVIPSAQLEEITGLKSSDRKYALAVLKIKEYIEKALAKNNLYVTLAIKKDDLCILTDSEASFYNNDQIRIRTNQAITAFERLIRVDASKLDIHEQQTHKRNVEVNGKYIQAIHSTRQQEKTPCIGYKRRTPGLTNVAS